jgi:hypothetical protein
LPSRPEEEPSLSKLEFRELPPPNVPSLSFIALKFEFEFEFECDDVVDDDEPTSRELKNDSMPKSPAASPNNCSISSDVKRPVLFCMLQKD